MTINRRSISALAISGALALGSGGVAQARHGNDDPPSHDAGDDHGARHKRHGGDDQRAAGARHRHGGNDDGPDHT